MNDLNDFTQWIDNRKRRFAIEDGQNRVNELNKIHRNHEADMETQAQASKQRIADYQQAANDIIATAREGLTEEPTYEPDSEDGMAQELLNRMDDNE